MSFGWRSAPAIEHGSSRVERFLRANRLQIALAIALAEAILVLVHTIPWIVALVVAGLVLVAYMLRGRDLHGEAQQLAWVLALSQVFVLFVPLLFAFALVLAIAAACVLALLMAVAVL
ncbi:MAG: hypothetical protein ACXVZP_04855, partial [Gaiellaceae bacterium]